MLKIHSYESMGTVDGPGLRFVIFLQGCNFRCLYCANPDTIEVCGGKETSLNDIFQMVSESRPFFGKRGGVTVSGGEPTLQAKELIPLFEMFKKAGIHTCIDTNGGIWNKDVERLLELTDLVMLDVKHINDAKHRELTAHSNSKTLEFAKWLEANSKPIWLRYVLVPGINNDPQTVEEFAKSLSTNKMVQLVEILPYHRLGVHKYEAMGLEYKLEDTPNNTFEEIDAAEKIMRQYFDDVVVA